jgi:hypothetical protein
MNDKIRELEKQCWSHQANCLDAEKFAELIVAECIEVLRLVPYNSDRDFGDEAIYQEAIDKHFGVQE